ncbi:hypothetical protein BJ912DRAFT_978821 [Pholiota molesta]|nr:hypothetical protein BJ912DRAFT_978821 [Pholiota molesta]
MDPELRSLTLTNLSAVSKLSTQILGRTLLFASADEFCGNHSPTIRARTARFTSQVNRSWREAALAQPAIWLGPVLSWCSARDWLDIVLKRSYPLPIDAKLPPNAPLTAFKLAFKHLSRIRNLRLELTVRSHIEWFEAKLRQHQAPILKRLSISTPVGLYQRRRPIRVSEAKSSFLAYAPMLEQLEIQNYSISLALTKPLHRLRVFVFAMTHLDSDLQLLDDLRNMDQLEELHISSPTENDIDLFSSSQRKPPAIDTPVPLLHLKSLTISAPISVCANIFRNIIIRDSCSIMLYCRNAYNNPDLRDILSRLKNHMSNWSCDDLTGRQSLDLGATYAEFILEGPDSVSNGQTHPFIGLKVFWPTNTSSTLEHLFAIFPKIASAFQSCKRPPDTLALRLAAHLSSAIRPLLYDCLHELDYVQAVEFLGDEAFAFYCPLLGSQSNYSSATFSDDILLPLLGDLIIQDVNFTSQGRQYWRKLRKTLRFRQKEDHPILEINLVDCDGDPDLNILDRYGVVIKVNGEDLAGGYEDDGEDSDYTVQADSD